MTDIERAAERINTLTKRLKALQEATEYYSKQLRKTFPSDTDNPEWDMYRNGEANMLLAISGNLQALIDGEVPAMLTSKVAEHYENMGE